MKHRFLQKAILVSFLLCLLNAYIAVAEDDDFELELIPPSVSISATETVVGMTLQANLTVSAKANPRIAWLVQTPGSDEWRYVEKEHQRTLNVQALYGEDYAANLYICMLKVSGREVLSKVFSFIPLEEPGPAPTAVPETIPVLPQVAEKPMQMNPSGLVITGADEVSSDGETQLAVTLKGAPMDAQALEWSCSDEQYATVVDGLVKAAKVQEAQSVVIKAIAKDDPSVKAAFEIAVLPRATKIEIVADVSTIDFGTIDKSLQLTAICEPDGASQSVEWTSSNEEIATVDEYGVVTAKTEGSVRITATAADPDHKKATFDVKILTAVHSIEIIGNDVLSAKQSLQLEAIVEPENATNPKLSWVSDDKTVATVSSDGLVKAAKLSEMRTVTITAKSKEHPDVFAEHTITLYPRATSVTIEAKRDFIDLRTGKTLRLNAVSAPADAYQDFIWTSGNEDVAIVDAYGLVTALQPGTATITAAANDGSGKSKSFTVRAIYAAEALTIEGESEITGGNSTTLTVRPFPEDSSEQIVLWESSDPEVATVDETGKVRGKGVTARKRVTIRASLADDPEIFSEFVMTVAPQGK